MWQFLSINYLTKYPILIFFRFSLSNQKHCPLWISIGMTWGTVISYFIILPASNLSKYYKSTHCFWLFHVGNTHSLIIHSFTCHYIFQHACCYKELSLILLYLSWLIEKCHWLLYIYPEAIQFWWTRLLIQKHYLVVVLEFWGMSHHTAIVGP